MKNLLLLIIPAFLFVACGPNSPGNRVPHLEQIEYEQEAFYNELNGCYDVLDEKNAELEACYESGGVRPPEPEFIPWDEI